MVEHDLLGISGADLGDFAGESAVDRIDGAAVDGADRFGRAKCDVGVLVCLGDKYRNRSGGADIGQGQALGNNDDFDVVGSREGTATRFDGWGGCGLRGRMSEEDGRGSGKRGDDTAGNRVMSGGSVEVIGLNQCWCRNRVELLLPISNLRTVKPR